MANDLVSCPNPACGRLIPAQSIRCQYCHTRLNSEGPSRSASRPTSALEPVTVAGTYRGTAMLTPESVVQRRNPWPWQPQAQVRVALDMGSETILSGNTGDIRVGVYRSGLVLPKLCPVTMAPADTQVWMEVAVSRIAMGKVTFPDAGPANAARIVTALGYDRYWLGVPYSAPHGVKNRAVGFTSMVRQKDRNWAFVLLTNRAYAQAFVALNRLTGARWLSLKHLLRRALGLLLVVLGLGLLVGYWTARSAGEVVHVLPPITLAAAALGVAGGIALFVLGQRGEPL
jgi:hypothetical protein